MLRTIKSEKLPIKVWCDEIESKALQQVKNIANLPFAFHHIALMPDAHSGYGMPIGGVLATKKNIIPNAVGVDIGCGMCAVQTSLTEIDQNTLKKILGSIRARIPVGFNHRDSPQKEYMPNADVLSKGVVEREYKSATYQIGTLGGGNHFIEIQKGSDSHIWIMIHSGSRNLGKKVADYYNERAKEQNDRDSLRLPKGFDLAYLPVDSKDGQNYLKEMTFCLLFAQANRALMMRYIKEILSEFTHVDFLSEINIHHNYVAHEEHFGERVYVHRKGATSARSGERGIIPGSQGSTSYIVLGKGNPESFCSCSHGAGRRMGRQEAVRMLNFDEEVKRMNEAGIVHSVRHKKDLDEAPGAYKDIATVMHNQSDLVDIAVTLMPRAVVKG
jgi:tRNA-splicing ligase RtcB